MNNEIKKVELPELPCVVDNPEADPRGKLSLIGVEEILFEFFRHNGYQAAGDTKRINPPNEWKRMVITMSRWELWFENKDHHIWHQGVNIGYGGLDSGGLHIGKATGILRDKNADDAFRGRVKGIFQYFG